MILGFIEASHAAPPRGGMGGRDTTLTRAASLIDDWLERHRQRRRLASLPDYLLRDMGISQAQVMHETSKPFWRG